MHCCQINEKCFRKYDNRKTIEVLGCESKNLKNKVIHLLKVTRTSWSLYTALICVAAPMTGFDTSTLIFLLTFLSYLFTCVHNRTRFLPYVNATILVIIFWDILIFEKTFVSPQVKRIMIISNKHGIYELPHELPNDLRLRTLGN